MSESPPTPDAPTPAAPNEPTVPTETRGARPGLGRDRAGLRLRGTGPGAGRADGGRDHAGRRPDPDPPGDVQPARSRRRGDGHREDQDPPAAGRAAVGARRAVFTADIKGDLSGLGLAGRASDKLTERASSVGQTWTATAFPVKLFALGGQGTGIPLRATMFVVRPDPAGEGARSQRHPGVLAGAGLPLRRQGGASPCSTSPTCAPSYSYLVSDEGKPKFSWLGGLSSATAGVILRELIGFADQGADAFFGEPEFESRTCSGSARGQGADLARRAAPPPGPPGGLLHVPDVAARRPLPRAARGGGRRPAQARLLLRRGAPALQGRLQGVPRPITQTVRLIRSKGVGVFFVTQSPTDVPDEVLAQLGSRVQHQLRAHTPNDAKALRSTVNTYPHSDYEDLGEVITSLGIGEAIVTVMNERGAPTPVAWTRLRAPESSMGPVEAPRCSRRPSPTRGRRSTPRPSTASRPARSWPGAQGGGAKAQAEAEEPGRPGGSVERRSTPEESTPGRSRRRAAW